MLKANTAPNSHYFNHALQLNLLYLHERDSWAVHLTLGQDWGDGPIFEVSVSRLNVYVKERPGKLLTLLS